MEININGKMFNNLCLADGLILIINGVDDNEMQNNFKRRHTAC